MPIRTARAADIDSIETIENLCFPPNEAASRATLTKRIQVFADHFWLLEEKNQILGFINGFVTDHQTLQDEMFLNPQLHNPNGRWQSVFGLAVAPTHRKKGHGAQLMHHLIGQAKTQKRSGVSLTCKPHLISYYTSFGFTDAGVSTSGHGGGSIIWHDMILAF